VSERTDGTPAPGPDQGGGASAHGSSAGMRAAVPEPPAAEPTAAEPTAAEPTAPEPAASVPDSTAPEYATGPVAFRRPDVAAALLLVLAGVAAGISLLLRWLSDRDDSGLELVRRGFREFGELGDTGFWQPLAVVLGGGALLLLGLLMLLPARTHRALGAVALLVSALAAAGVLVPIGQDSWRLGGFGVGFWFAIAVPVLGVLGSLKALLTWARTRRI
jgi:hypothetical protein